MDGETRAGVFRSTPARKQNNGMQPQLRFMILATLVSAIAVSCDRGQPPQAAAPETAPTTQPVSSTQPAAKRPEYLNVLEAVFRYQFDHNASGSQRDVDYF